MHRNTFFIIFLLISSCGINKEKTAQKEAQKEESIKQEYLQIGEEIVTLTQAELLKNVSQAMKTGGPGYAIEYCNLQALSLKDSLSRLNNCQIRRIATKYRNPIDQPQSKTEKDQLLKYQLAYQQDDSIKPTVYLFADRIEYYHPIILNNGACLICHGKPGTQIADETLEKINSLYPNDLATGFELSDFRGSWKISFMK